MNKAKFMQTDSRWGGLGYPKKPWYIRNCGCGEVSIANILIEMDKYANYTPATIQPYCKQFAASNGDGTYWSGIPAMMKHYGLTEVMEHATMDKLWNELAKGDRVAVYLMGKRKGGSKGVHWTSGGHYVVSVGYKYENGKHYVYVKDSYSNASNRNGWISYEENMRGDVVKVWSGKLIGIEPTSYRPTTPYTGTLPKKVVQYGTKGEDAKACQNFLNWCIDAKLSVDGNAKGKTEKAIKVFQKTYGLGTDGKFGSKCRAKANEIIEAHKEKPKQGYTGEYPNTTVKTTKTVEQGSKIVAKAKEYAYPLGTASSKYSYSKGSAKPAYKTALKKYMGKTAKVSQTDCGYFSTTCVRASGVSDSFLCLPGSYKKAYPAVPSTMYIAHTGKISSTSILKSGDIIRYRKSSGQHTVVFLGGSTIAHASREHAFPRMATSKPWTNSNVKTSTIQVLRAKAKTEIVTRYYLMRGDEGEEVKKLQKYINWFFHDKYGKDVLAVDGKFGVQTENYAKLMQSELGFKDADALVGEKTVNAMKAYKK